jgi:serine/threonine-protein kinase
VVADRRAGRRLRGDLDAIVLSALAERPEDRYGSAQALAHDLELHLGSRPIGARPAPWTVRSAKFVRRHRLGAAAGALALALVAGALVGAVVRVRQAERDRERAERVTAFLTDVLAVGDPNSGEGFLVGADTLLRRAVERADSELGDRPDLQAAVFHQVGEVLIRLRLEPDARAALARAVELRRRLTPRGSDELIASLVRYGYTFQLSERTEEGVPALEEAVRLSRELYGADDPRHADALLELATYASRFVLAGHPRQAELLAQARERYAQALVIYRRRFGDVHPKVGAVLRNLAFATPEPAEQIALLERALAAHGNEPEPSAGLGYALADLGIMLDREGRQEEALVAMRRAFDTLQAVEGDNALIELTVTNNLAAILRDLGRYAEAEPLYREVLARRERLMPNHHTGRAYALYGLGRVALGLGNAREAELHLSEAAELLVEAEIHTLAAIARGWLSEALAAQGRLDEALALAESSAEELATALGADADESRLARRRLEQLHAGQVPEPGPLGAIHTPVEG